METHRSLADCDSILFVNLAQAVRRDSYFGPHLFELPATIKDAEKSLLLKRLRIDYVVNLFLG